MDLFINFFEISEILQYFQNEELLSEELFTELLIKRPKVAIRCMRQLSDNSIKELRVYHTFVNNIHSLQFPIKVNLLMKLIQSITDFKGSLSEAKELTNQLLRCGCAFNMELGQFALFEKLFFHNIALNLVSIDDRIEWQFKYIWFLAKKPQFKSLHFSELQDYWNGAAVPRLKRIDPSKESTADKCRKFVNILLISGNFADFEAKLKPNSLELLDKQSLKLLLYYGFDFGKCLKNNNKDIEENYYKLESENPNLINFLTEVEYFGKPLELKHQLRVYFRRREGSHLNQFAKQLYKSNLIPETLCDYLRYRSFVQF